MSDRPESGTGDGVKAVYTGDQPNPVIEFLQRPRIMLLLLAGWSILTMLTETFTASGMFMDNHDAEIDGAIGGLALNWQGIPLAVLYVYCFRNPARFGGIFWLALIHMASIATSQFYHWMVTDDYTFESIAVPLFGSIGLGVLVFVHLFQRKRPEDFLSAERDPAHSD